MQLEEAKMKEKKAAEEAALQVQKLSEMSSMIQGS